MYWEVVGPEARNEIIKIVEDHEAKAKHAGRISRRVGAHRKNFLAHYSSLFGWQVSGFLFKNPPDKKFWKPVKNYEGGWFPKKLKPNMPLIREIDSLSHNPHALIHEALGRGEHKMEVRGGSLFSPSYGAKLIRGDDGEVLHVLLETKKEDDNKALSLLPVLIRISDVEWEELTSEY